MTSAKSRVYVDVDDVLCRTAQAAAATVRELFGISRRFEQLHSFELDKSFGLSPEQLETLLTHLNSGTGLLAIPPRSGAADCLRRWSRALDICVVTGRSPKHWRATRQWLDRESVVHHRLLFANKYGRFDAEDYGSGAVIVSVEELAALKFAFAVEDSADFSQVLSGLGIPVLLLDRPWNRDTGLALHGTGPTTVTGAAAAIAATGPAPIRRCADWKEVERTAAELLPRP